MEVADVDGSPDCASENPLSRWRMSPECLYSKFGQPNGAPAAARLWRIDSTVCSHSASDLQRSCFEIHVRPLQPEHLTYPHARGDCQRVERFETVPMSSSE